jgi:transposase
MDQVHVVRHKVLVEGRTQRAVARELGLSRVTVKKYLAQAAPVRHEAQPRRRPVSDAVGPRIAALLEEAPRWTTPKQRLTATRLHQLLRAEGHDVGVSLVKAAVAEWKRQRREPLIPLTYRPGELAEVDFFEVQVDVAGRRQKAWLFVLRLMYSGRDFGWIYERQDQVSFLDGHVRAFAHLGGVPMRLAYDNLKPAVARILAGGERALTIRFAALASHYLFEPSFCRPGVGHDKGGVESRGKYIRLQALTPIPAGDTLDVINVQLLAQLDGRLATRRHGTDATIGARFVEEQPCLRPLDVPFVADVPVPVSIAPRALARVHGAWYSVPCGWAGLDLTAWVGATTVTIVGRDGTRVTHARQRFGGRSIDYRHYLPALTIKPQAIRQVAPDLLRDLGDPFPAVWAHLTAQHAPRDAARHLAKILGDLEAHGATVVVPALEAALRDGTPLRMALRTPVLPALASDALPASLRDVAITSGVAADYDRWLQDGAA